MSAGSTSATTDRTACSCSAVVAAAEAEAGRAGGGSGGGPARLIGNAAVDAEEEDDDDEEAEGGAGGGSIAPPPCPRACCLCFCCVLAISAARFRSSVACATAPCSITSPHEVRTYSTPSVRYWPLLAALAALNAANVADHPLESCDWDCCLCVPAEDDDDDDDAEAVGACFAFARLPWLSDGALAGAAAGCWCALLPHAGAPAPQRWPLFGAVCGFDAAVTMDAGLAAGTGWAGGRCSTGGPRLMDTTPFGASPTTSTATGRECWLDCSRRRRVSVAFTLGRLARP